jgi:hypothetical protein
VSKNTSSVSGLNSTPRAYYSRVILWWTLSTDFIEASYSSVTPA